MQLERADGTTVYPLQPAQDFKRIFDGDQGPNTGGMGAYTPLPWAPDDLVDEVIRTVLQPTVDEMARRGTPFAGLLYAGLALTSRGVRVVEFNARFGDPETQPLLALLDSPLVAAAARRGRPARSADVPPPALEAGRRRRGGDGQPRATPRPRRRATSSSAPSPRPRSRRRRHPRRHGPAPTADLVTAGGRVLAVTAVGADVADARAKAYDGVAMISFPGAQWRRDIAAGPMTQDVGRGRPVRSERRRVLTARHVPADASAGATGGRTSADGARCVRSRRRWPTRAPGPLVRAVVAERRLPAVAVERQARTRYAVHRSRVTVAGVSPAASASTVAPCA